MRWKETVLDLDYMVNNVAGDVLLSAAYVAYLGPFTVSNWVQLTECLRLKMHEKKIVLSRFCMCW